MKRLRFEITPRLFAAVLVLVTLSAFACSKKEAPPTSGSTTGAESPADMKARLKKEIDAQNAKKVADELKKEIEADH